MPFWKKNLVNSVVTVSSLSLPNLVSSSAGNLSLKFVQQRGSFPTKMAPLLVLLILSYGRGRDLQKEISSPNEERVRKGQFWQLCVILKCTAFAAKDFATYRI